MRIEKSADELDMVSEMEISFTEKAIEAVTSRLRAEHHPDFNGCDCLDCAEPLMPLRLVDRRMRCVPCQDRLERRIKTQGGRRQDD